MKKEPFVTLEKLNEITEKFPTPFHLYDEKGITLRFNVQLHSYPVLYITFLHSVHFPGTSHKQAVRLRAAQPYVSSQVREAYLRW